MPYFYRNNIKYSGGSDSVDLTMAEYKELEANGKVVQDITYYIIDADENIPSRPNLLINSNFANPVNQRGITAETWNINAYGIDRWSLWNNGSKISSINSNGISIYREEDAPNTYGALLSQRIEPNAIEYGKVYTISACIDNEIYSQSTVIEKGQMYRFDVISNIKFEIDARESDYVNVGFRIHNATPITIKWAKLELGEYATPYVPRLYAEELQLCYRYYQRNHIAPLIMYSYEDKSYWMCYTFPTKMRVAPTINIPYGEYFSGVGTSYYSDAELVSVLRVNDDSACVRIKFPQGLGSKSVTAFCVSEQNAEL